MTSSKASFDSLRRYMLHESFAKLGICQTSLIGMPYRIFCGAESRRDGNLTKELAAELFMQKEDDGPGRIDGRSAADGNNDIGTGLLECIYASVNSRNGSVLSNIVEGGRISILFT